MAIVYEITWMPHATSDVAWKHVVRKRHDAAAAAIYDTAREMVASWAGLDTQWGWQFMRDVMAEPIAPLDRGTFRHFRKSMPQGDTLDVMVRRV